MVTFITTIREKRSYHKSYDSIEKHCCDFVTRTTTSQGCGGVLDIVFAHPHQPHGPENGEGFYPQLCFSLYSRRSFSLLDARLLNRGKCGIDIYSY